MTGNGKGPGGNGANGSSPRHPPGANGRHPPRGPRIVVIGGGSGSSVILEGLKQHACEITAIVTMFDSGGSSGLLRKEFGYPPFGDLRRCLVALRGASQPKAALPSLLGFSFCEESSLHGHNLGNLVLAGLTSLFNVEEAIDELGRILRVRGEVVPVSLEQADLCAEFEDGQILTGESAIDLRRTASPRISRVFLQPSVRPNPRAIRAILHADAVVLGPGDLYTSILPNLLVRGVPGALRQTRARRIYVCNLMTKPGETDGFKAFDFVSEVHRYLGGPLLSWAVVNTATVSQEIEEEYARAGAIPVAPDLARLGQQGVRYFGAPLADGRMPVRHLPCLLAQAILRLVAFKADRADQELPALQEAWAFDR